MGCCCSVCLGEGAAHVELRSIQQECADPVVDPLVEGKCRADSIRGIHGSQTGTGNGSTVSENGVEVAAEIDLAAIHKYGIHISIWFRIPA